MSELRLQEGEYYLDRAGRVAGPLEGTILFDPENAKEHPFSFNRISYSKSGMNFYGYGNDPSDLVEHIPITDPRHPEYNADIAEEVEDILESYFKYSETQQLNNLVTTINVSAMPD